MSALNTACVFLFVLLGVELFKESLHYDTSLSLSFPLYLHSSFSPFISLSLSLSPTRYLPLPSSLSISLSLSLCLSPSLSLYLSLPFSGGGFSYVDLAKRLWGEMYFNKTRCWQRGT